MNEISKTVTFAGVAVLAMAVAVLARPGLPEPDANSPVGTTLNEVKDPLTATHLKIVEFLEDRSTLRPFEVKRVGNRWVIPSHQDYPADAQQQMADAATSVMNLEVLGVVSNKKSEHETYGVVEPNADTLEVGTTGVGMLVTMDDQDGKNLVKMIIGKEVKDQEGQRYVREAGRETVYVVKLDTKNLKTEFGEWIEKDLLKLNPSDIRQVRVTRDNVAVADLGRGEMRLRKKDSLLEFAYNETDSKWETKQVQVSAGPQTIELQDVAIPENEELDQTKLNDLKTALDDLKIVDVEKKPEGLSANLKADKEVLDKQDTVVNLAQRGFVPVRSLEGPYELLSAEGELIVGMKDGAEYLLRFGGIVRGDGSGDDGSTGSVLNRYLFVTARVNEDLIAKPELAEVPPAPAGEAPAEEEPAEKAPAKESAAESEKPAAEPSSEEPAEEPTADAVPGDSGPDGEPGAAGEAAPQADATDAAAKADDTPAPAAPPQEAKALTEEEIAAEQAKQTRQQIIDENARKQKQYDDKVQQAEERVKELNERFADWYYVVSDDVYKKVVLGRKDVFKPKEAEAKEGDAAAKPPGGLDGFGGLSPLAEEGLQDLEQDAPATAEPAAKTPAEETGDTSDKDPAEAVKETAEEPAPATEDPAAAQ